MSVQTAAKPSLTIKRRLNASPARVFSAWTEPQKIMRWFGPAGAQCTHAEFDARVGGRFTIAAISPNGERHQVGGTVREVVPDRKLVYSWAWHSTPERESLVTVEFKPDGEGTLLTLTHEQFFDQDARDRHQYGWNGALDKLEQLCTFEEPARRGAHGTFYWNELLARDVDGAKRFYAETLGWSFEPMPTPDNGTYWIATIGGQPVGGIFEIRSRAYDGVPESWMAYIAVDDVDARVNKALAAGATVMRPAFEVPGVGRIVILKEPGGAGIGWMTPSAA
jgi:uncharacterized protein YndB with AHSA1/START domain/predicted enzyme related to lactoylglutathione lyase